jgi:hypothetical protein
MGFPSIESLAYVRGQGHTMFVVHALQKDRVMWRRTYLTRSVIRVMTQCGSMFYQTGIKLDVSYVIYCGPGSSVGIATRYGRDGSGIKSRWGRDFPHLSRLALGPTQPPVQWVQGLSRGKERPGRDADPSPPSSAVGHERVELYLYSPYGPYGLHRASVPEQGMHFTYFYIIYLQLKCLKIYF